MNTRESPEHDPSSNSSPDESRRPLNGIPEASDSFDDDEPEFSLAQLSEAYAEVIEQQTGQRPVIADPDAEAMPGADSEDDGSSNSENDEDDDAACPISPESIVEAILFVGVPRDASLTARNIASILPDVSTKEVNQIVKRLNRKYTEQNAAYRIESIDGNLQLAVDPSLREFQNEYYGRNRQARLSQAAIDVMAIVAYNQPTTRQEVESVRGKPSGTVLAQLVRRELLSVEFSEEKPRERYYRTTDRFLDLFQLDEVKDLPQSHDMSDIAELAD